MKRTLPRLTSLALTALLAGSALAANGAAPAAPPAAAAPAAPAAAVDGVVAKVQKFYEGVTTLKANFTQTSSLSTLKTTQVQQGVLYLSKPGKMRWEFQQPSERLFVSDGTTLYIYSKADNQVIVQKLKEQATTAVNFLLGMGDLKKDFTVTAATEPEFARPGRVALSMTPKAEGTNLTRMVMSVDEKTGQLFEAWTFDPMGNKTQLAFSNIQLNTAVDAGLFTFKTPAGAEVIEGGF